MHCISVTDTFQNLTFFLFLENNGISFQCQQTNKAWVVAYYKKLICIKTTNSFYVFDLLFENNLKVFQENYTTFIPKSDIVIWGHFDSSNSYGEFSAVNELTLSVI